MQTAASLEVSSPLTADIAGFKRWQIRREKLIPADLRGNPSATLAALTAHSQQVRRQILRTIKRASLGHIGGDFSVTDILVTLFELVLNIDPSQPNWDQRDRFILSKGHCAAALYSTLAECGFFPSERLAHFAMNLSPLNGHPNRNKIPGVETNTGPLGHGLPVAVGCATAAQLGRQNWRTFVVLGDGELQEGSNWEAAMCAAHRRLGSLTAVVDRNRLQQGASTAETNELEPLFDKWQAFGWDVFEVDGHSHAELCSVFQKKISDKPRLVIANTIKGKGVSFMENGVEWHHKVPSDAQYELALKELSQ